MTDKLIFLPALVQVLLTLALYVMLLRVKIAAFKNKEVDKSRVMLHDDAWPPSVIKVNNNITNQFHVPMLFFALITIIYVTNTVTLFDHAVAWIFVLSRIAHSYIHIGPNTQPLRRQTFTASVAMVFLLLISAAVSLFV